MKQTVRQLLDSPAFARMATRRRIVAIALTVALLATYYGYIVLVAMDKPLMAHRVGGAMPLGIPLAVAVIVLSWALTAIYVVWANAVHDRDVRTLKDNNQ